MTDIISIIEAPEGLSAFYISEEKGNIKRYKYFPVHHLAIVQEQTDDGVILSVKGMMNTNDDKSDSIMFADAFPKYVYMDYPDEIQDDEFQEENSLDEIIDIINGIIEGSQNV